MLTYVHTDWRGKTVELLNKTASTKTGNCMWNQIWLKREPVSHYYWQWSLFSILFRSNSPLSNSVSLSLQHAWVAFSFAFRFHAVGDKLIFPCVTSCPGGMCNARTPLDLSFSSFLSLWFWVSYIYIHICTCIYWCASRILRRQIYSIGRFTLTGQSDWIQRWTFNDGRSFLVFLFLCYSDPHLGR